MMLPDQSRSFLSPTHPCPTPWNPADMECLTTLSYRSGDLSAYLTEIVRRVNQLLGSDWTIITLCDGGTGRIVVSSIDLDQKDASFSLHGSLAEVVVQSGRSLLLNDDLPDWRNFQFPDSYRGYLGIPLRATDQQVMGTICSFQRQPRQFEASVIKTIESFATRAAIAIENYRLYHQQLQFNEQLSQAIAISTAELKQSQEKLIERERLAALGEFTAMIVHEIRNPLTTIQMGLRFAQKVLTTDIDRQRLDLAVSESQRLTRLLQEILYYAKPQVLQRTNINISQFLADMMCCGQQLPEAAERSIHYVQAFSEIEVIADPDKLKQVFLNLLRNALEAIAPGDTVRCWLTRDTRPDWITIRLHNGGAPIPPELLPQLTTPFCSTKPMGTGLGLAISKRIIVAHGGELEITSSVSGTTVSVHLPIMGYHEFALTISS
ncbi:MAG: ATP-binding protein [Leptolyngbyaceae cyanobacterium bins.349]|nr:ATP-binding protein [Leptolyngbyaceae cyanobacterium bins.349]